MTDVAGNPEEERRADFYYQPWAQEAVCRYFYGKVRQTLCIYRLCCVCLVSVLTAVAYTHFIRIFYTKILNHCVYLATLHFLNILTDCIDFQPIRVNYYFTSDSFTRYILLLYYNV